MVGQSEERWNADRDDLKISVSWIQSLSILLHFVIFFTFFLFFIAKLIKHIILSRNVLFLVFRVELEDFSFWHGTLKKTQVFQFSFRKNPLSLPFKGASSDEDLWKISTGWRHHLLYYSGMTITCWKPMGCTTENDILNISKIGDD